MSNREFREFWIYRKTGDNFKMSWGATWNGLIALSVPRLGDEEYEKDIHVIEYAALIEANRKLGVAREALETIAKTEKPIYPHSMSSTSRFNMAIASQALEEIK